MEQVTGTDVTTLRLPARGSHKGQNGRLLIIGGSELFHAASAWALTVASRIVDLVHYASTPENNDLVRLAKHEFRNGIVISRDQVNAYIKEDDCILIGPGMTRDEETSALTHDLLVAYPDKRWVIDAGALQMLDLMDIPKGAVLTPHHGEFTLLLAKDAAIHPADPIVSRAPEVQAGAFANRYACIVILKGDTDTVCSPDVCRVVHGGNPGMTKGGTGDVLAGLVAALATTNDPWTAATAGSYINKAAADALFTEVGPYFNASDLAAAIPRTMKRILFP